MRNSAIAGWLGLLALVGVTSAGAQSSASYRVESSSLNQGGRPSDGLIAQSASFRITLDAVGEAVPPLAAASASFGLSGGPTGLYAPPVEVQAVGFASSGTMSWAPMPSAMLYNLYRGVTGTLPGTFGSCLASNVATTGFNDPASPGTRSGYFYLVTGENRLGEQGTKGYQSNGAQRTSSPACP